MLACRPINALVGARCSTWWPIAGLTARCARAKGESAWRHGSGSTLIACEKAGHQAGLMELDPRYVDVIVSRWKSCSGEEAVLVGAAETGHLLTS